MRKTYTSLNLLLTFIIAFGSIITTLTSCVDNDYDLDDNNLDKDITIGGNISLPLGNTLPITLEDLLEDSDIEGFEAVDGIYKITMKDSINETFTVTEEDIIIEEIVVENKINSSFKKPSSPSLNLSSQDIDANNSNIVTGTWNAFNADITTNELIAELEPSENNVNISAKIPNELTQIDSVKFRNTTNGNLSIVVNTDGIDSDMSFDNYTIEFPKFIKFDENSGAIDNKLVLNDLFTYSDNKYTYNKVLIIKSFDFTDPSYKDLIVKNGSEQQLIINDAVKFSGNLKLTPNQPNIGSSDIAVTVNVNFIIEQMEVGKVYGIIDSEIEIEDSEIDLSDLAELSDDLEGETSAILTNPAINLVISNSLTVPVEITTLTLQPTKDGKDLKTCYTESYIKIAAADEKGASITKICVSSKDTGSEEGVQYVKMKNIKEILDEFPSNIIVKVDVDVKTPEKGENHMIDLEIDSYELKIDYNLDIPLAFDALNINYTTEIEDLKSELEDIIDYISELHLELDVQNTLPISLTIDNITPKDASGGTLSELDSFIVDDANIIKANTESSIITLVIKDKNDLLKQLDALDINIKADVNSADAGQALKPEQFIKIKMHAKLPNGLEVNLDEI